MPPPLLPKQDGRPQTSSFVHATLDRWPTAIHFLRFLGVAIVALAATYGIPLAVGLSMRESATTIQGLEDAASVARGLALILIFVTFGFMGSQVGYRWRDGLSALVPFYGPIYFWWKIYWRFASLPRRYWDASSAYPVARSGYLRP